MRCPSKPTTVQRGPRLPRPRPPARLPAGSPAPPRSETGAFVQVQTPRGPEQSHDWDMNQKPPRLLSVQGSFLPGPETRAGPVRAGLMDVVVPLGRTRVLTHLPSDCRALPSSYPVGQTYFRSEDVSDTCTCINLLRVRH